MSQSGDTWLTTFFLSLSFSFLSRLLESSGSVSTSSLGTSLPRLSYIHGLPAPPLLRTQAPCTHTLWAGPPQHIQDRTRHLHPVDTEHRPHLPPVPPAHRIAHDRKPDTALIGCVSPPAAQCPVTSTPNGRSEQSSSSCSKAPCG